MMRTLLAVALLEVSLLAGACSRQKAWQSYTTSDGLVNNSIRLVFQDHEGYLWVGTQGGVAKFDGEQFVTVSLKDSIASDDVVSMFEDDQKRIWFITKSGVKYYDGEVYKALTIADGLPDNVVTAAMKDRTGHVWLGTRGGLSRFSGDHVLNYPEKNVFGGRPVSLLYEDRNEDLWVGLKSGGLVRVSSKNSPKPSFRAFSMRVRCEGRFPWNDLGCDARRHRETLERSVYLLIDQRQTPDQDCLFHSCRQRRRYVVSALRIGGRPMGWHEHPPVYTE
jgi:hypothetical protein